MNKNKINNQPSRHNRTSLFVIIVQYNNSDDIISCLKSLKEQTFTDFETIIVDNASNRVQIDNIRSYLDSQVTADTFLVRERCGGGNVFESENGSKMFPRSPR